MHGQLHFCDNSPKDDKRFLVWLPGARQVSLHLPRTATLTPGQAMTVGVMFDVPEGTQPGPDRVEGCAAGQRPTTQQPVRDGR